MNASTDDHFRFKTKLDLTILLGRKAINIRELLDNIRTVPNSSIYFHTHKFLQQHNFLSPEPPNDFAYWITNVLNERALGERISSVDTVQYHRISDLRARFIQIVEDFLTTTNRVGGAPPGQEFYFMSSQTFVIATPYNVATLQEFQQALEKVSLQSLYYHMFDARLRLEHEENDFSIWFRRMGKTALADAVRQFDPYTLTLDRLRRTIIRLVDRHGSN